MKYTIRIMRSLTVLFTGELVSYERVGEECYKTGPSPEVLDQAAFDIEKAINQQTDLRCHIESAK